MIGFFTRNRTQTFDAWFDDATKGLCDFAKSQVREEYEDHFAAAYEDLRAEGLGQEEAEAAAVGSLGDARAVRRQLRNIYLTWREEKGLERIGRLPFPFSLRRGSTKLHLFSPKSASVLGYLFFYALLIVGVPCRLGVAALGPWGFLPGVSIGLGLLIAAREGIYILYISDSRFSEDVARAESTEDALIRYANHCLGISVFFGCLAVWYCLEPLFSGLFGVFLSVLFMVPAMTVSLGYLRLFFLYRPCARKVGSYPKQNATLNVLALRYRLEEEQEMQESGS